MSDGHDEVSQKQKLSSEARKLFHPAELDYHCKTFAKLDDDDDDEMDLEGYLSAIYSMRDSTFMYKMDIFRLAEVDASRTLENCFEMGMDATILNANEFGHGRTLLHVASARGSKDTVEMLLKRGEIDVCARDAFGRDALFLASRNGHLDICARARRAQIFSVKIGRVAVPLSLRASKDTMRLSNFL